MTTIRKRKGVGSLYRSEANNEEEEEEKAAPELVQNEPFKIFLPHYPAPLQVAEIALA